MSQEMDKALKELSDFFKSRNNENKHKEKERIARNAHLIKQAQSEAKSDAERLVFEKIVHDSISFVDAQFDANLASIQKVDFKKAIVSILIQKINVDFHYFDSSIDDRKFPNNCDDHMLIICDQNEDFISILDGKSQRKGYVFNRITEKSEKITCS